MKVRKLKFILICFLISVMGSVVWSEFYLSQRNILAFKKNWHLDTIKYLNPNIVSAPILTSPHLLQGYRLKSNFDLGIVRILSNETLKPVSGKIWFRIEDDGFVDLIFNSTDTGFSTLRLSRSTYYPSGIYHSDSSGKYRKFYPLKPDLQEGHHLLSFEEGSFQISGENYVHPELRFSDGKTGIQISPANAEVFFYKINDQLLHSIPDGSRWGLYSKHLMILFILSLGLSFIPRMGLFKSSTALLGLGSIILLADLLIGIDVPKNPEELKSKFEKLDSWWTPEGQTLKDKLKALEAGDAGYVIFHCRKDGCGKNNLGSPLPEKTGHRVMIFGGSQSKYGLISEYEESMHFRFDRIVRQATPDIETINLSTPGLINDRIRVYGSKLDFVKPDTIIIESMILDEERETIKKFLSEVLKRGIRIILLRTPQNLLKFEELAGKLAIAEIRKGLESNIPDLPRNMQWLGLNNLGFIREIKNEFNLIFLDPNEVFLTEQLNNSGQLFWDSTHMTIYGQKIFGEWLGKEYLKLN